MENRAFTQSRRMGAELNLVRYCLREGGRARRIFRSPGPPMGRLSLFSEGDPVTLRSISILAGGRNTYARLLPLRWTNEAGMFSPDGHWLVYAVRQANREEEIFVQPYPRDLESRRLISTKGGAGAGYRSPTRRKIFYRSVDGTHMMTVDVQTSPHILSFPAATALRREILFSSGRLLSDL